MKLFRISVSLALVIVLFSGCTLTRDKKVKTAEIDCKDCRIKLQLDILARDNVLDIDKI